MGFKIKFDNAAGKICEAMIPIKHQSFEGRGAEVAICTLGSITLLEEISKSDKLMSRVAIAGRLLSENKGIDVIIYYVCAHPKLKRIILCGNDVKGHRAGQALLALHKNGIDMQGKIIGAVGPYPILEAKLEHVMAFQTQITITDLIGVTDIEKIFSVT